MSEFRNTRPDSPKGKVFTAFEAKGEKAARAKAKALEIPDARVNRWLKDEGAGFQNANDQMKARKEKGTEKETTKASGKRLTSKEIKEIADGKTKAKTKNGKAPAKVHALTDPDKRARKMATKKAPAKAPTKKAA